MVDALVARFGLAAAGEKVTRRYHELETGQIQAGRADPALLAELAALLGARVTELVSWKPRPLAAQAAYYRADVPIAAAGSESDGNDRAGRGRQTLRRGDMNRAFKPYSW
jgi:hypothetical protein